MVPFSGDPWQFVLLGLDAVTLYLMRRWYQSKIRCAEDVEGTVSYEINDELKKTLSQEPDQCIAYGSIEGKTHPLERPLQSQFKSNEEGVIQKLLFVEHKSKRANGYWSDVKKTIKDQVVTRPFSLCSDTHRVRGSPLMVEVSEPLSASFLMDELTTTYDNYVPTSDTLLSRGIDRIFGDVSKGYQETEQMLSVGVKLLGVGKITLIGEKMVLEPPSDTTKQYILTTLSKKRVVSALKGDARIIKIFMWVFGLCGAGLLGYLAYRNFRRILEHLKMSRLYREIQEQRERKRNQRREPPATAAARDAEGDAEMLQGDCVICLSNPREVVLLECGHICICGDCARMLPEPRRCPICRKHVTRLVSTYIS